MEDEAGHAVTGVDDALERHPHSQSCVIIALMIVQCTNRCYLIRTQVTGIAMINLNQPDSERNALCIVGAGIFFFLLGLFYLDNDSSTGIVDTQQISSLLDTTCYVVDVDQVQYGSLSNEDRAIADGLTEKCKVIRIH